MVYKPNERWGFTTCAYIGNQEVAQYNARNKNQIWAQGNFTAAFYAKKSAFLSARIEYFSDQEGSILQSLNYQNKFSASSLSVAYNLNISSHALFRIENRLFYSERKVFTLNSGFNNFANLLIANLTVWF
jgi:hypothetical protein